MIRKQFPSIRGELERLTLTRRGEIDGLILKDGTEVKIFGSLHADRICDQARRSRDHHGLRQPHYPSFAQCRLPTMSRIAQSPTLTYRRR